MSPPVFIGNGRLCLFRAFTVSRATSAASVLWSGDQPRMFVHRVRFFVAKTLESEPKAPFDCGSVSDSSLESPERSPSSVINLLRGEGFTDVQISRIICIRQLRIRGNPKTTILPKLEFFRSVGCSNADIAVIFSRNPVFLMRSLDKFIVPCYEIIKNIVGVDAKAVKSFRRSFWHSHLELTLFASNIGLLREAGVSNPSLSTLLINFPSVLFQRSSKVSQVLTEVVRMEIDPSKSYFVIAMWVLSTRSKSTLESKLDMLVMLGLSREDALTMFKKYPLVLLFSVAKIKKVMEFLLSKTPWQCQEIAECPRVFLHSLEKRTIPRSYVAHVLRDKGLVNKIRLSTLLSCSEELFVKKYITRFQGDVPRLLDLYKGKVSLANL